MGGRGGGQGIGFWQGGSRVFYILREKTNLDMTPSFLSPSCLFIKVSPLLCSSYFHHGQSDTKHPLFVAAHWNRSCIMSLFHVFSSLLVIQRLQSICFLNTLAVQILFLTTACLFASPLSHLHSPKLVPIISHPHSKFPPSPGCHSHIPFPWSQYQICITFANFLVQAIFYHFKHILLFSFL